MLEQALKRPSEGLENKEARDAKEVKEAKETKPSSQEAAGRLQESAKPSLAPPGSP